MAEPTAGQTTWRVAFVGIPNSGKTSLFNAVTGQKLSVGNWPGTSVEVGRGRWRGIPGLEVIDLPGAYSLQAHSPDEQLARDVLLGDAGEPAPDVVVVVADVGNLPRGLYRVAELRERPVRVIVALTRVEAAARQQLVVDVGELSRMLGCPVVAVSAHTGEGTEELARAIQDCLAAPPLRPRVDPERVPADAFDAADQRFAWVDEVVRHSGTRPATPVVTRSERADNLLLHPVAGPFVFLLAMWLVFQTATATAGPVQVWLEQLFAGPVSGGASWALDALHINHPMAHGLVLHAIIGGVGTVLSFLPLMAIMFGLLALLEESGYMARGAVIADRLMRSIGLPGMAFLPIIVGFGCNVPAITSARSLANPRHRLLTVLLIPLTSCSGRLTVYVMVAQAFFPAQAGTVVFAMYLISILLVVLIGLVLKSTVWRAMGTSPLVMELPRYQVPRLRQVGQAIWVRVKDFLHSAGGVIMAAVVVVWLLQAIPITPGVALGEVAVADSLYGALAASMAPLFVLTGFGDWRIVGALVTGLLGKEAIIATWAQTFAAAGDPGVGDLNAQLTAAFAQASGGHPQLGAAAFLVFLLSYAPCLATLTAQAREIGMRWVLAGLLGQFLLAWTLATLIFRIGLLVVS